MVRAVLCWSGGKDCAWALGVLRVSGVEVAALLTAIDRTTDRVAMHAVRRELVEAQAAALDLPLQVVPLPWPCPNHEYERSMAAACERAVAGGVTHMAFGDLHLADIRAYREARLAPTGLQPLFPVWGRGTAALAGEMIAAGLRARVVAVDTASLARTFLGREYDAAFLDELPPTADPCGENGEFHTFAWDGPMFRRPVAFRAGETREEAGHVFTGLLPG